MHAASVETCDRIFGAFDSIPPNISITDVKIATRQSEELITAAQDLGSTRLISSHVGNALLQHRQLLYKAILQDPPRYLLIAIALKNDTIFTESLIHLVGTYSSWRWPTRQHSIPEEILRLIKRKSHELETKVLEAECELLLLTVTTNRRVPYSAAINSEFDT